MGGLAEEMAEPGLCGYAKPVQAFVELVHFLVLDHPWSADPDACQLLFGDQSRTRSPVVTRGIWRGPELDDPGGSVIHESGVDLSGKSLHRFDMVAVILAKVGDEVEEFFGCNSGHDRGN